VFHEPLNRRLSDPDVSAIARSSGRDLFAGSSYWGERWRGCNADRENIARRKAQYLCAKDQNLDAVGGTLVDATRDIDASCPGKSEIYAIASGWN
jgi:hypothetical protein